MSYKFDYKITKCHTLIWYWFWPYAYIFYWSLGSKVFHILLKGPASRNPVLLYLNHGFEPWFALKKTFNLLKPEMIILLHITIKCIIPTNREFSTLYISYEPYILNKKGPIAHQKTIGLALLRSWVCFPSCKGENSKRPAGPWIFQMVPGFLKKDYPTVWNPLHINRFDHAFCSGGW